MSDAMRSQQPKLLDEVRTVLRLHHSSIHTQRSSMDWIVRVVRFHNMRSRTDLFPAEPQIEAFLTDLAVHGTVAPATQNQAMKVLGFLQARPHPCSAGQDHCRARGQEEQRSGHHLSRHLDTFAPEPSGWGQDVASAGPGSRTWRGVPPSCSIVRSHQVAVAIHETAATLLHRTAGYSLALDHALVRLVNGSA